MLITLLLRDSAKGLEWNQWLGCWEVAEPSARRVPDGFASTKTLHLGKVRDSFTVRLLRLK